MQRIRVAIPVALLLGAVAIGSRARGSGGSASDPVAAQDTGAATPPAPPAPGGQPIPFPHDRHAGEFQIDCQYCHFSAERSVDAGIPSVATCMGCHLVVGRRLEGVQRLLEYADSGKPIPWVRIYKVADHVHFPHMRHVNADVDCTECHGPVQEMREIRLNQPLRMGWCVACHREREAPTDCTVCHY